MDELQRNGVRVEFVNQPDLGDNPQAHLLLGVQGLFAEYERAMIKERLRMGRLYKMRTGQLMHNAPPYGYRYISLNEAGGSCWVIDGVFGVKGRKRTLRLSQIAVDADRMGPDHHLYRSGTYRTD